MIQYYYGNGKGKTTAALGQALRMSGYKKVLILQFLKSNSDKGEVEAINSIKNIEIMRNKSNPKFSFNMSENEKEELKEQQQTLLLTADKAIKSLRYSLIVLDEIEDALSLEIIDNKLFYEIIENLPDNIEIVITGHKFNKKIADYADYVTEIKSIKHPYSKGIKAREGIEF